MPSSLNVLIKRSGWVIIPILDTRGAFIYVGKSSSVWRREKANRAGMQMNVYVDPIRRMKKKKKKK